MIYKTVLTIAGSDPSGGAGIQADLKTFSALGCYGMAVVTALTAQNTTGVRAVEPVSAPFVSQQLTEIFNDIEVNAIKIGMVHDAQVVDAIAAVLRDFSDIPLVLDPVMIAKGGASLLADSAVESLRATLLPLATVITPNAPEAARLLGVPQIEGDPGVAAQKLLTLGGKCAVLKGGHLSGDLSTDYVASAGQSEILTLDSPRIMGKNLHGTGCTFSAAIAALLAKGIPLLDAITGAKHYISGAIASGAEFSLGHGHGPVDHLWMTR